MKKLLIFITLALTAISTYAQTNTKLDSLHTVINSEVNQTTRGLEEQITLINTELKANKEQQQQALKSLEDRAKSMIGDSLGGVRPSRKRSFCPKLAYKGSKQRDGQTKWQHC
jgi:DNA anti-recombination protein RmuC